MFSLGCSKPVALGVALVLAVAASALPGRGMAEDAAAPRLRLELNAATPQGAACRLSFVVENRLGADLDAAVFETVLFTADGQVDRLTLFDFGALPEGRMRVRQFDLDGLTCDGLGRVLINAASRCEGEGVPQDACMRQLETTARDGLEISG